MNGSFADALRWHLDPFLRPRPEGVPIRIDAYIREEDETASPPLYSYVRDGEVAFQREDPLDLVRLGLWDIQYRATQGVRSFLALHAGAVATDEGGLLLPAPADTGKSTTVSALLRLGFRYLSDEVGAIDPVGGRVYPFPKHLWLDQSSVALFPGLEERLEDRDGRSRGKGERTVRPGDLGATVAPPSTVRWVVFMSPERSGPPRLIPISRAEAVERLAANAFNLYRYRDRGVVLLSRVAAAAQAFALEGGTALERAAAMAERFPPNQGSVSS